MMRNPAQQHGSESRVLRQGDKSRIGAPEIWFLLLLHDRLCGLVVRVIGYRSGGPGSIPSTTRKKNLVGLNGVHSAS
jgi:hypothetical protein